MSHPGGVRRTLLVACALAILCVPACGGSRPTGRPAAAALPSTTAVALPPVTQPAALPPPTTASPPATPLPSIAGGRTVTLGTSAGGRSITAVELGDPAAARTLVVVGCIHGDETAGIAVARRLESLAPSPGTDVWVIEDLNPDGVAAGTRQNHNGVDLNRNFPFHWGPLGPRGSQQYAGTSALSEPESRLAYDFLRKIRPAVTIWFHQPLGVVDLSGGDPGIEQRYAAMVGLPVQELTRYPGSAPTWENHEFGGTAFVVELPAGRLGDAAAGRYAAAALSLLQ